MKRLLMALLVLAFAAEAGSAEVTTGSKAPAFKVKDLAGKTVQLSDFKGKQHVLLVVWSSGCPVSVGELSPLEKLHQEYQKAKVKPLVVLGVNIDELSAEALAKWGKERRITFTNVRDEKRGITRDYEATVTPTFILIDKEGVIQSRYASGGEPIREALAQDVAELVRDGKVTPREQPVMPTVFG